MRLQQPYGSPIRFDQHPDYAAAKAGDPEAAAQFVDDMIDPARPGTLRATIGERRPIVVAVHAEEAAAE